MLSHNLKSGSFERQTNKQQQQQRQKTKPTSGRKSYRIYDTLNTHRIKRFSIFNQNAVCHTQTFKLKRNNEINERKAWCVRERRKRKQVTFGLDI